MGLVLSVLVLSEATDESFTWVANDKGSRSWLCINKEDSSHRAGSCWSLVVTARARGHPLFLCAIRTSVWVSHWAFASF